ncbi:VOC family protein [Chryseobacterium camelliae]|uniref:VOC family protein n=1 Tax=Chryseobacterium camelliae TaxID=1265445 RepID=UPI00285A7198|nr:VOC family protein [Chryseobacterium camelliae]MDR6513764.1 hypothetical protein [Chryseobacterium camelliae]
MFEGLYETHIQVSNLGNAVQFYTQILGLELAHYDETRPIAFLWIGVNKKAMLGLWEQQGNLHKRHFAFSCSKDFILKDANTFLKKNGLKAYNFLKMAAMNRWFLPRCPHLLFILTIRTEINWSLSIF